MLPQLAARKEESTEPASPRTLGSSGYPRLVAAIVSLLWEIRELLRGEVK